MNTAENTNNNLENNEIPKDSLDNIEQQGVSKEEFLEYAVTEGAAFKNETAEELQKSNTVDLDGATFEKIKTETNVEGELSAIDKESEAVVTEAQKVPESQLQTSAEGTEPQQKEGSFIAEKGKEEKFAALKDEFEKFYKEQPAQEYSLDELKTNLNAIGSNPQAVNALLEKLPKNIVEDLKSDNYSLSAGAISSWLNSVGGQIGKLSNERSNVYNESGEVTGTASVNSEEYLATVANASRFVPKEVSQKFVLDALNNFTNEDARNSTGARFMVTNEQGKSQRNNIVRNLVEGGYGDEVKNFLSIEVKKKQMIASEVFAYAKQGLFSEEEVKEVLDNAGLLEEEQREAKNESWG